MLWQELGARVATHSSLLDGQGHCACPAELGARGQQGCPRRPRTLQRPRPVGPSALTLVLDQGLHLLPEALMPARDVHAQAVVAAGLAVGVAAPLLVGGQEAAPRVRAHVVNCGDTGVRDGHSPGTAPGHGRGGARSLPAPPRDKGRRASQTE